MKTDPNANATKDFFSYFIAYFPDFPPEDQMDGSQALDILVSGVESARRSAADQATLHWGELCRNELAKAADALGRGENDRVERAVGSAREFFEYLLDRRKPKSEFVADESGRVTHR